MEGCKVVLVVMGWALVLGLMVVAEAQEELSHCLTEISPCATYINSTNPPQICCKAIKVIDKTCFCQLALSPNILQGYGINLAQALKLVQLCSGINFNINSCKASPPVGLPSSLVQPPATPGGEEGGAGRIRLIGLSFLLLFWALVTFN